MLDHADLALRIGHRNTVETLAFSADGLMLASGGWDGMIKLWDPVSGALIKTLAWDFCSVHGIAFSPDGSILAASGWLPVTPREFQACTRLYELETGRVVRESDHAGGLCIFSLDGDSLFGVGCNGLIAWNWRSGEFRWGPVELAESETAGDLILSGDGKLLAVVDETAIRLHDADTGEHLRTISMGEELRVGHVGFLPDGNTLAAIAESSADHDQVFFWEAHSGALLGKRALEKGPGWVFNQVKVQFPLHGRFLVIPCGNDGVLCWDVQTGRRQEWLGASKRSPGAIKIAVVSPDGTQLASAGDGGIVTLWDARTFHRGHRLGQSRFPAAVSLAVSPNGDLLAGGGTDGTIRLWNVESRCLQSTWTAHAEAVSFVRFLPDGRRMVSASGDGTVIVWDVGEGRPIQTYAAHDGELCSAALSRDGSKIVTRGYGRLFYGASQHCGYSRIRQSNAEVKVWAIDSGEILWSSSDFPFPSRGALFSPDESRLFIACDAEIVEQDWISGKKRLVAELDRNAYFIAPGPDDGTIAIGGEGYELPVLDAATGQNRTALWSSADGHRSAVFSPDGREAAVATCYVDYVDLIDVLSGEIRAQLPGRNTFTALAFAPDGRYLATANADGTIRLWDPENAKPKLTCTLLPPERESDVWTDWLTYWPEGRRCGSPRAEQFIQ